MSDVVTSAVENGLLAVIVLLCIYGLAGCYKHSKTVPGADILVLGILIYGMSTVFAIGATGFTGSFFDNYSRVGPVSSASYMYFISVVARMGLVLLIIALFRVGRGLKA